MSKLDWCFTCSILIVLSSDMNFVFVTAKGHSEFIENHEAISSDEDPPTVTPTPVFGSPERDGASQQSPEPQPSQNKSSTKLQFSVSADQSVVSSPRSEVLEELDYPKSESPVDDHDLSHSSQCSQPVLKLDLQLPSQRAEDFAPESKSALSGKSSHEAEKRPQSGDREEDMKLGSSLLNKPLITSIPEKCPSPVDESPTSEFSPRKYLDDHKETSPSAGGYDDDFELSQGSSFWEDNRGSEPTSPSALQPKEKSHKSSSGNSEEEIDEELSVRSGITSGSFHPEKPLDLDNLAKSFRYSFSDDVANSPKSPTTLPSRTETSPHVDEMPSYFIGDRVLVSNIQPGTLRFKGQTSFANGFWAGVELDKSEGSNDGTYDGVVYFQCKTGHGIFAPPDKVTPLPEKFESYVDTTEDEDSSFDDQSNKMLKDSSEGASPQSTLHNRKSDAGFPSEIKETSKKTSDLETRKESFVNSELDLDGINCNIITDINGGHLPATNGENKDIVLELEDMSNVNGTLPIHIWDKGKPGAPEEEQMVDILDLLVSDERSNVEGPQKSIGFYSSEKTMSVNSVDVNESRPLDFLADKLLDSFMNDAVQRFQEIKKLKEKKITTANQQKEVFLTENDEFEENNFSQFRSSVRTEDLHAFFDKDQEEVSSPELCNRSVGTFHIF